MKKKLQKWLGIVDKETKNGAEERYLELCDLLEKKAQESIFKLDWFMNQYHAAICDNCGKGFLAHYGGMYRTRYKDGGMTRVACSSKCCDELKEKE